MALESRIRPRIFWFNVGYAVLCAILGAWGAYDYWERIPRQDAAFAEYRSATERVKRYADMSVPGAPRLTAEQEADYQAARQVVDKFASGAPTPVAAYDRPLQLWVYMIGCGILGTGWCLVSVVRTSSRSFALDDDGTLRIGARAIGRDDVEGVDMSRWMAKSIAKLRMRGGEILVLDDYKYTGLHLLVGHYAHRFEPQRWNADATPVKRGADASAVAANAESGAESAGVPAAPVEPGSSGPSRERFPSA